jgi:hypothetical protein
MQRIIKTDISGLKVLTPGSGTVLNPMVYKFPQPVTTEEIASTQNFNPWAPIMVRAKKTKTIPAQPMRMKEKACLNIQYLNIEQDVSVPEIMCMLEDKRGNMWFGSAQGGICSFDNLSVTYFTTSEGFVNLARVSGLFKIGSIIC